MSKRAITFILVALVSVAYPFMVYFGLSEYGIRPLAILLLVILSLRIILWQQFKPIEKAVLLTLVVFLCSIAAWLKSESLLRYYPVLMNFGFGIVFILSLRTQRPLIERLASIVVDDFPEIARRYLRGLTLAWGILLIMNGIISAYTACCLSLRHWTIYNGAVAYVIFGVFALAELVNRYFYKKRHKE